MNLRYLFFLFLYGLLGWWMSFALLWLLIGAGLSLLWLMFAFDYNPSSFVTYDQQLKKYVGGFLCLWVASFFTLSNYIYPNAKVFRNVNYHSIEHLGYEISDSAYLIHDTKPEWAFFDEDKYKGKLLLKRQEGDSGKGIKASNWLYFEDFYEPLYVQDSAETNHFLLKNASNDFHFTDSLTFGIKNKGRDSLLFSIVPMKATKWDEREKGAYYYLLSSTARKVKFLAHRKSKGWDKNKGDTLQNITLKDSIITHIVVGPTQAKLAAWEKEERAKLASEIKFNIKRVDSLVYKDSCWLTMIEQKDTIQTDTASFKGNIATGISVAELFSDNLEYLEQTQKGLDFTNCYLLRKTIASPLGKKLNQAIAPKEGYCFFPSLEFAQSITNSDTSDTKEYWTRVAKDGVPNPSKFISKTIQDDFIKEKTIRLPKSSYFMLGIDQAKRKVLSTEVFPTYSTLLFDLPTRYPLRDTLQDNLLWADQSDSIQKLIRQKPVTYKQFITSDAAEIMLFNSNHKRTDGGFYFNYFQQSQNIHHVSGEVKYKVGSPRERLFFELIDNYLAAKTATEVDTNLHANQLFTLETKGVKKSAKLTKKETNLAQKNERKGIFWRMKFKDQRESCPVQLGMIFLLLSLFTLAVSFRILILQNFHSISRIELGIYPVIYCFLLFRCLLQWRIATFYPLEDIEYNVYTNLVVGAKDYFRGFVLSSFYTPLYFFLLWFLYILIGASRWKKRWSIWLLLLVSVGIYIGAKVFHIEDCERLANLFVPIILYYVLDQQLIQIDNRSRVVLNATRRSRLDKMLHQFPCLIMQFPRLSMLLSGLGLLGVLTFFAYNVIEKHGIIETIFHYIWYVPFGLVAAFLGIFYKVKGQFTKQVIITTSIAITLLWVFAEYFYDNFSVFDGFVSSLPMTRIYLLLYGLVAFYYGLAQGFWLGAYIEKRRWLFFATSMINTWQHPSFCMTAKVMESLYSIFKLLFSVDIFLDKKIIRRCLLGLVCIYLMLQDPGYSVMFLLYVYIHEIVLSQGLTAGIKTFSRTTWLARIFPTGVNHTWIFVFALAGLAVGIGLGSIVISKVLQPKLLGFLDVFKDTFLWYIMLFIPIISTYGLWYYFKSSLRLVRKWQPLSLVVFPILFILFGAVLTNSSKIAEFADKYSYIRYRAAILGEDINGLVSVTDYRSKYIQKIQQSSHNQWFINHYLKESKENKHYFQLQPHFRQGVSYITQASDVVVTRYVIAEHQEKVIYALLGLLLLLGLLYVSSLRLPRGDSEFSLGGLLTLLFTTALFVYLTATNRFTFFGQDFPILSVESKVTMLLTFSIFFLILIHHNISSEKIGIAVSGGTRTAKGILGVVGFVFVFPSVYYANNLLFQKQNRTSDNHYDISGIVNQVESTLKNVNHRFRDYQQGLKEEKERGERTPTKQDLNTLLTGFHGLAPNPINGFQMTRNWDIPSNDSTRFVHSVYQHFINHPNQRRNPDEFVHVRRRNGNYTLAVNRRFYFLAPPEKEQNKWQGDLTAASTFREVGLINLRDRQFIDKEIGLQQKSRWKKNILGEFLGEDAYCYQSIVVASLPAGWVIPTEGEKISEKCYLIRRIKKGLEPSNQAYFSIINDEYHTQRKKFFFSSPNNENLTSKDSLRLISYYLEAPSQDSALLNGSRDTLSLKKRDGYAIFLKQQDEITLGYNSEVKKSFRTECAKRLHRLRFAKQNGYYFAKNIWINGKYRFFYPLGRNFNWSYNYASLNEKIRSQMLKAAPNKNDSSFNKTQTSNVSVAIDYKLTESVYEEIVKLQGRKKSENEEDNNALLWEFMEKDFKEKIKPPSVSSSSTTKFIALSNSSNTYYLFVSPTLSKDDPDIRQIIEKVNKRIKGIMPKDDADKALFNEYINNVLAEEMDKGFDASVVALDGYGRIRLMVDYDKRFSVDPNEIGDYKKFLNQIYQNSSTQTEQDYFGNQSLLVNLHGVGSSFKPIVYAAVTSQANLNWDNWKVEPLSREEYNALMQDATSNPTVATEGKLKYYAGNYFGKTVNWSNIGRSEFISDSNGLVINKFLPKSNNVYHSSIFYLGSFDVKDIRENLTSKILQPSQRGATEVRSKFPYINYNGLKSFTNIRPNFKNDNSALATGLRLNFDLITSADQRDARRPHVILDKNYTYFGEPDLENFRKAIKYKGTSFEWCYPEWSDFLQSDRESEPVFRTGFANPGVGSYPIRITPLKMAELGLRLYTLNSQMSAHLDDAQDSVRSFSFFDHDPDMSDEALLKHYQKHIYAPMYQTMKTGTAAVLKSWSEKYDNPAREEKNERYYFYSKTGTTSARQSGGESAKLTHKRLLVIISNKPLHDPSAVDLSDFTSSQERKSLKVYAVFLVFDELNSEDMPDEKFKWNKYAPPILDKIIQSETFQNYMKGIKYID